MTRNRYREILAESERAAAGILFSVAIAILCLASVYAFLAFPQADELFRAKNPRFPSIAGAIWSEYLGWSGRWAAMLTHFLTEHERTIFRDYPFLLLGTWLITAAACWIAVSAFFERRPTEPAMVAGGPVIFAVLFLSAQGHENLFWFTGAVENLIPVALGLILLSVGRSVVPLSRLLLCCALAFVTPGFHELIGGWIVAPLAVLFAGSFFIDRKNIKRRAMVFASGLAGAAVVFLAPGNFARFSHVLPDSGSISLDASLSSAAGALGQILMSYAYLLPLAALFVVAVASWEGRPRWYAAAPHLSKVCLAIGATLMPFCMILFILLVSAHVPMRALDGIGMIGVLSFLGLAAAVGFDAQGSAAIRRMLAGPSGSTIRLGLLVLSVLTAAALPASAALLSEMSAGFQNREVIWMRKAALNELQATGARSVVVRDRLIPMKLLPTYFDITEDEADWRNQVNAIFFRLDCLRLARSEEIVTGAAQSGPPCLGKGLSPWLDEKRQQQGNNSMQYQYQIPVTLQKRQIHYPFMNPHAPAATRRRFPDFVLTIETTLRPLREPDV